MTAETAFIDSLRKIAMHPAARGLADDAAVLDTGDTRLIFTHDMIVEGVHFLAADPPQDVAWKLLAVNLSDLAAKGAEPLGVLMGYGLTGDTAWDSAFVDGLEAALTHYNVPLLGGDTVKQPAGNARTLGLTAIGKSALAYPPARSGARAGDSLYVTGPIGDGWAGLQLLMRGQTAPQDLVAAYRRPVALLAQGQALAPHVHAMMDISDGLLIDAARMAEASGLEAAIRLDAVPLSQSYSEAFGDHKAHRLQAATGGDDYQLLFAAPGDCALPIAAHAVGTFLPGSGLFLSYRSEAVALPSSLGFTH